MRELTLNVTNLDGLFAKAQQDAKKYGIPFSGDKKSGGASWNGWEGSYTVNGNTLTLIIEKMPGLFNLASDARIKKEIREYYREYLL